jgi:hypothetical protein
MKHDKSMQDQDASGSGSAGGAGAFDGGGGWDPENPGAYPVTAQ